MGQTYLENEWKMEGRSLDYQQSIEMLTADVREPSYKTMNHGQCDAIAQT